MDFEKTCWVFSLSQGEANDVGNNYGLNSQHLQFFKGVHVTLNFH